MTKFLPSLLNAGVAGVAILLVFAALLALPTDESRAALLHLDNYPLHCAAGADGDLAVVVHLLEVHELDVNARAVSGLSCLSGKSRDLPAPWGRTPLHYAVQFGHMAIAATLIAAGANLEAKVDEFGWTPLHEAAQNDQASAASLLLTAGGNANAKDSHGFTPLDLAAHKGHASLVSVLLAAGAKASGLVAAGKEAFDNAAADAVAASVLLAVGEEELAKHGQCPPDIEVRDAEGNTPLYLAVKTGEPSKIIALINCGANVNALNEYLETPLHEAVFSGAAEIIRLLVDHGANLEAKNRPYFAPLDIMLRIRAKNAEGRPMGWWDIAFERVNADGHIGTSTQTPLHIAARSNQLKVLTALLDGGANIEAPNYHGETALHLAVFGGNSLIVAELVKRGANLNATSRTGKTPLEYAAQIEEYEIVDKLQKATQQAHEIPQEKPKAVFPTAKTEAGDVFELTWRSVVVIETGGGQGSGVALKPNLVATNCHVTDAATSPIAVFKGENRRADKSQSHPARVVAGDRQRDVCLLEVSGLWAIPAETRKAAEMKIAEQVYAVGAPKGLDFSISGGLVSQLRGEDAEGNPLAGSAPLIQTDTAISPGSSGGGLFDAQGKLVGLTTFGYRDSEGLNFAVPIEWAMELVPAAE